ncbi:hypothetical protein D1872_292730 [compost metagenome]
MEGRAALCLTEFQHLIILCLMNSQRLSIAPYRIFTVPATDCLLAKEWLWKGGQLVFPKLSILQKRRRLQVLLIVEDEISIGVSRCIRIYYALC